MKKKTPKKNKINEQKSSLFFKIVLSLVFICAFMFVWFAGYVYADTSFQRQSEKTSIIIAVEPKEKIVPIVEDIEPVLVVQTISEQKAFPVEETDIYFEEPQPKETNLPLKETEIYPEEPQAAETDFPLKETEETTVAVTEESQKIVDGEFEVEDFEEPAPAQTPEPSPSYIAVVIDDMGISQKHTDEILSIHAPLTSSFLTYGKNLNGFLEKASNAGQEVIMHTPMEPKVEADLAPDTLKISMTDEQIEKTFSDMLSKFDGTNIKGINNHMGSLFTESAPKLDVVMKILKEKNMFFLDSKTSKYTRGPEVAKMEGVPCVVRDVFLDNENDYQKITAQLSKLEKKANENGFAVGIGHPKSQTFAALKDWLQTLENKNIKLVHLSDLIALKNKKNEK